MNHTVAHSISFCNNYNQGDSSNSLWLGLYVGPWDFRRGGIAEYMLLDKQYHRTCSYFQDIFLWAANTNALKRCKNNKATAQETSNFGQKKPKPYVTPYLPQNTEPSSFQITSVHQVMHWLLNPVYIILTGNVSICAETACGVKNNALHIVYNGQTL